MSGERSSLDSPSRRLKRHSTRKEGRGGTLTTPLGRSVAGLPVRPGKGGIPEGNHTHPAPNSPWRGVGHQNESRRLLKGKVREVGSLRLQAGNWLRRRPCGLGNHYLASGWFGCLSTLPPRQCSGDSQGFLSLTGGECVPKRPQPLLWGLAVWIWQRRGRITGRILECTDWGAFASHRRRALACLRPRTWGDTSRSRG